MNRVPADQERPQSLEQLEPSSLDKNPWRKRKNEKIRSLRERGDNQRHYSKNFRILETAIPLLECFFSFREREEDDPWCLAARVAGGLVESFPFEVVEHGFDAAVIDFGVWVSCLFFFFFLSVTTVILSWHSE